MQELKDLVTQVQNGQTDVYNTIVKQFQDMAVGYAYSILGDFHLAQDVAQEAFINAYLDLSKLQEPAAFPGWFRRVVFTQCNRLTRGKKIPVIDIDSGTQIPTRGTDPETQMEAQQNKDQIEMAIQTLSEHERTIITLFYINDFSQAEIATFLEIPVTTVNNRLHTARKHLKRELMNKAKNNLQSKRPSQNDVFVDKISNLIAGIKAVRSGNLPELQVLLKENSDLVKVRADNKTMDKKHNKGYFSGATLLHYVAGNPIRGALPPNIIEITETLLSAGADVDACTQYGDWSWTTLGLVASGMQAIEQGFSEKLIDTLLDAGADINYNNGMNLYGALVHTQECQKQKDVAKMLFDRGAEVDLCFASALGELDIVKSFFDKNGTLKPNAYSLYRRHQDRLQDPTDQDIMEEAFIWASFNNSLEVVDFFLTKNININATTSIGGIEATGLHRTASAGWKDMVQYLISKGADVTATDSQYQLTPLEWAKHAKRENVVQVLQNDHHA